MMDKESIYKNYVNDIYRYSYFKLRNKELSEDVTSETFLRFFENENKVEVRNKKSYLIGTARNIIFDKYKQKNVQSLDQIEQAAGGEVVEDNYSIDKEVMDQKLIELIKNELDQLDEQTREVIILKIWEEMQFNEIAEIVGEAESTIKLRFYRGIEKLKIKLGEKKQSKKVYSVTLPIIIGSIGQLAKASEFTVNKSLLIGLGAKLGLSTNLIITSTTMKGSAIAAGHAASKGILASTGAKIAAVIGVGSVVLVGTTVGVLSITHNNNNNTPVSYPTGITNTVKVRALPVPDKSNQALEASSTLLDYTISNSDGSSLSLKYPSNWKVESYDNGKTYALVSPNGSALGYDFDQYQGFFDCQTNKIVYINNPNQKFARYFDDQSNEGVNWYVCDYGIATNKYYIDNSDLLTINAVNDSDLATIDQILMSIVRTRVDGEPASEHIETASEYKDVSKDSNTNSFSSLKYNVSFDYPTSMGKLRVAYNEKYFKDEFVSFSDSPIVIQYWRFEGGFGGPVTSENLTTKDGKQCTMNILPQGVNNDKTGILVGCGYQATSVTMLAQNLEGNQVETVKSNVRQIVQSMQFNLVNPFTLTTHFSSSRYNVSFDYLQGMGNINVNYNENYFKDEIISFDASPITIQYWRYEGALAGADKENLTTKDGKSCSLFTGTQAKPTDNAGKTVLQVYCLDPNNPSASFEMMAQNLDQVAIESTKNDMKQIVQSLQFDLRNAPN